MNRTGTDIRFESGSFTSAAESPGTSEPSFVEALVDPVSVFGDPQEVVRHPWFTDGEKRTILLSWARDALAREQLCRETDPELKSKSPTDAVIAALSRFDPSAAGEYLSALAAVRGSHAGRRAPRFGPRGWRRGAQ